MIKFYHICPFVVADTSVVQSFVWKEILTHNVGHSVRYDQPRPTRQYCTFISNNSHSLDQERYTIFMTPILQVPFALGTMDNCEFHFMSWKCLNELILLRLWAWRDTHIMQIIHFFIYIYIHTYLWCAHLHIKQHLALFTQTSWFTLNAWVHKQLQSVILRSGNTETTCMLTYIRFALIITPLIIFF